MSGSISTFFEAWQIPDASARREKIIGAVVQDIKYDDPRTPETINGIEALNDYLGMFSANAPGWSAKVVKTDIIGGVTRCTVAFGGKGPDGTEQVQLGQYFAETEGGLVTRLVGFVGTGEQ
jgi:hypothetical protein